MSPQRYSKIRAAAHGQLRPCRLDCGRAVLRFTDDIGCLVQLEPEPLPDTTDITSTDYADRLWEHRGIWVGWIQLFHPRRGRHPLHAEHRCTDLPPSTAAPIPKGHCA